MNICFAEKLGVSLVNAPKRISDFLEADIGFLQCKPQDKADIRIEFLDQIPVNGEVRYLSGVAYRDENRMNLLDPMEKNAVIRLAK